MKKHSAVYSYFDKQYILLKADQVYFQPGHLKLQPSKGVQFCFVTLNYSEENKCALLCPSVVVL